MALSLQDLLNMPDDVQPEHLAAAGLIQPTPPPTPAPQPPPPMATPAPPTTGPQPEAPTAIDGTRFFKGLGEHPKVNAQPMPAAPTIERDFDPNAGLGSMAAVDKATSLPHLNFKQRQNLPETSPGVGAGSSTYFENKIDRLEDQKKNPYGSPENHKGFLGKVAHVAAKIGNVAGEVAAPGTMALIPETELGKRVQEKNLFNRQKGAQETELAKQAEDVKERQEDTRELHEENFRHHQEDMEQQGQEKIDALFRGLEGKETKTKNDKDKWLRAAGMKTNPDNPDGPPIEIPDEELSPKEKQQTSLMQALFHSREAKAAYDEYRADPTNPQAQAALKRAQAAVTAAGAAARRAGVEEKKFLADYVGTDENGQPLAGVELTDEGQPIGVKVSGAPGNKVTNATRTMAEFARTVQPQIELVKHRVQNLSGSLGPAIGRWNELMTNRGGADFPEFAGLDQDLDLLSSAIVRTHFGARGGQQYREALRKNFGEAQSPEDLLARIDSASTWIQGYAEADQQHAGGGRRHAGDRTPPATPNAKTGGGNQPQVPTRTNKKTGEVQELVNGQWQTKIKPRAAAPAQ